MPQQHTSEVHLSSDISNDWRAAQTLDTFGQGPNGQPLMSLQQTPSGKGRVIFNPDLMKGTGLSMFELQSAVEQARVANLMKGSAEGERFVSKPVLFKEQNLGGEHTMQFTNFLDLGMSSRVWIDEAAGFAQVAKATAFFNFVKDNLPRAVAHFPQEMGMVGQKLQRGGMPIPATSVPVLPLDEVVQRFDNRPTRPAVAPTPNAPRGLKA